ncbi:hypothetical protein BDB00DRAFT_530151 [Zychaea mexicana]|uniref:uncharacterized protein n=1 Tax=Zychaea mexicana TaxID=64656 RepID=UPI0022FE20A0|nr:uncharacterized protein BDB00DRAFT_530151 [Zychaea mexicana]KAI9490801.1 hypothetical protein BDB00DRAFT_530151 [Zychaea mexicana]
METALDALRPMSANTDLSISSIQSLSDSDSTSSSSYNEDNGHDDDDDAQEGTTATTLSTNTSSNTLAPSKPTSATATTPIAASSPATAFGIVLPWYQYAHDHAPLIPEQGNGKIMMADPAEIGRQLAVSHAVLTAMDFSTLSSVLDAEKWQRKYTNAKSSVDTIRDRVLLETRIQRTYASMLKLAVDRHSRLLIKDLQARTSNIDQLTQELYYTFSHVCDSQERYLHHLAGTLAVTIQSDERLWRSTSFAATAAEPPSTAATATTTLSSSPASNKKRREEYPDVVLRLEKIAKRCSSSLTTNMSQQYQQDILKRKTKSTTTTRRNTDNMSDDGNLSDDSMFLASVRTSMTSFDDHQQAHALLDIIEKQLSVYGGNGAHVAGDKSTSAGVSTDSNNADLQEELVRLRKREAEMQHRLDTQSSEFSRQRLEWERQLMQATQQQNDQSSSSAIQQKLEQQVAREIEDRKSLEESRRRLEEALRHADHHQAEIQRQLEDSQRDQAQQCQELNQALSQAKHHESRLQEEQTVLQDRIQELEQTLKLATEQQSLEQSSRESAKIYELNQALLQANQRERELVQRVQRLEETTTNLHNEHASRQRNSEQSMLHKFKQERHAIQAELEISRQQETEARSRLDALNAQVKQALTSTSMPSLDAMVDKLIEQQQQRQSSARPASRESSNQQQALDNLRAAFKEAQEEYTRREAALMLQSASVEAELGAIFKEYDKLTRNIADFNYERKKYDQQVQALMREKHLLDKQLADYKVKDGIGKDGQTMTLRKEFRQLMATVKAEHEQAIEKEMEKRRQVESDMRNMKHELEMKRWDTVSTAVQTSFVAYPPPSNATTM